MAHLSLRLCTVADLVAQPVDALGAVGQAQQPCSLLFRSSPSVPPAQTSAARQGTGRVNSADPLCRRTRGVEKPTYPSTFGSAEERPLTWRWISRSKGMLSSSPTKSQSEECMTVLFATCAAHSMLASVGNRSNALFRCSAGLGTYYGDSTERLLLQGRESCQPDPRRSSLWF